MEQKKKAVRAVQYEINQEMVNTLYKLRGIGEEISLLICSFKFLGDFVLDNHFIDVASREAADGWFQSLMAGIEKLERYARDIEIIPGQMGYELEKAIEAVHGEDKRENAMWKKNTSEIVDRLGALSLEMREILETVTLRIDEERKAERKEAAHV